MQKTVFEELTVEELNSLYEQYPESESMFSLLENNRDLFSCFTKADSAKFLKLSYSELYDFHIKKRPKEETEDELDIFEIDYGPYEYDMLKDEYDRLYPVAIAFWKRLDSFDKRRGILLDAFPEYKFSLYGPDAF